MNWVSFFDVGAINPDQGDIFVLQELAESATRSKSPFLFITVLHQAVDRYAEHMSPGRRAEWGETQGRFEDVAFKSAPDDQVEEPEDTRRNYRLKARPRARKRTPPNDCFVGIELIGGLTLSDNSWNRTVLPACGDGSLLKW